MNLNRSLPNLERLTKETSRAHLLSAWCEEASHKIPT
jgi:hypothetical protein